METSYIDLIMRLSLALVLGGAIGLEREYRAKEAGFRTHFLVALGSRKPLCIAGLSAFRRKLYLRGDSCIWRAE